MSADGDWRRGGGESDALAGFDADARDFLIDELFLVVDVEDRDGAGGARRAAAVQSTAVGLVAQLRGDVQHRAIERAVGLHVGQLTARRRRCTTRRRPEIAKWQDYKNIQSCHS